MLRKSLDKMVTDPREEKMHSTNGTKTPQNIKQHENSKEGNVLFSKLSTIRSNILPILSQAT